MRKLPFKIIVLLAMLLSTNIKAQIPVNDTAWVLQTGLSDEFTGSSINNTLWDTTYCYKWSSGCYNVANGAEWNFLRNDSVAGGYLYIKSDTLKPNKTAAWGTFPHYRYGTWGQSLTYAYQGGVMRTQKDTFKFGYVEIRAKYPSHKYPLWPAFWLIGGSTNYYNEIDIAENAAAPSDSGFQVQTNFWVSNTSSTPVNNWLDSKTYNVIPKTDSLSGAFHKFAAQWNPHTITYYFDDAPIRTVYDPTGDSIPKYGMKVILSSGVDPWYSYLPSNWNNDTTYNINPITHLPIHGNGTPTKWPQHFIIDYMRYYKLGVDCSNTLSICTPADYNARKVQKSITVGGGTCTPNFNETSHSTSYTLRATDYVELDAGTTINPTGTNGAYFAIEITPCPQ